MSEHTAFIQRALSGDVDEVESEIDDAIEDWHARGGRQDDGAQISLHDWLGMTSDEYSVFVEQPKMLRAILYSRRYGADLGQVIHATSEHDVALAARGSSKDDVAKLVAWLRSSGRLN